MFNSSAGALQHNFTGSHSFVMASLQHSFTAALQHTSTAALFVMTAEHFYCSTAAQL
jgi:hypothetical protein